MYLETTGIDHVNLQVRDLDASIKFWQNFLGFKVLEEFSDVKGVILGSLKAKIALYENKELGDVRRQGFSHLGFHISNFDKAKELCERNGVPILYKDIVPWPMSHSLYIEDPNGYEIELTDTWGGGLK